MRDSGGALALFAPNNELDTRARDIQVDVAGVLDRRASSVGKTCTRRQAPAQCAANLLIDSNPGISLRERTPVGRPSDASGEAS